MRSGPTIIKKTNSASILPLSGSVPGDCLGDRIIQAYITRHCEPTLGRCGNLHNLNTAVEWSFHRSESPATVTLMLIGATAENSPSWFKQFGCLMLHFAKSHNVSGIFAQVIPCSTAFWGSSLIHVILVERCPKDIYLSGHWERFGEPRVQNPECLVHTLRVAGLFNLPIQIRYAFRIGVSYKAWRSGRSAMTIV